MARILLVVLFAALAVAPVRAQQSPQPQWVEHLAFNVSAAPLDNVTLRQAIASAINRQALFDIAKTKLTGRAGAIGPAGSWFPPFLSQHSSDLSVHPYDPGKARGLLEKAGYANVSGLPEFELLYRTDSSYRQAIAEELRGHLAVVGIRIKVVGIPGGTAFFQRVMPGPGRQGNYQMAVFAWGDASRDSDFLAAMFLQGGPQNAYGYRNPDVTLLIADIKREADPAKRLAMIREAERLILTDAPVVPLFYYFTTR